MADPRDIVDIQGLDIQGLDIQGLDIQGLDIRGLDNHGDGLRAREPKSSPTSASAPKPFLMIWFRCCSAYGRLPKSADGLSYAGRCPKCLAKLEVPVGEGGTSRRMFEAE